MHRAVSTWIVCVFVIAVLPFDLAAGVTPTESLLQNGGFEDVLAPAWSKRTPEDESRKLYRTSEIAHSGTWCVVLENVGETFTRLRQGHERTIVIPPGSLVELSAWVKSDLTEDGVAMVQLYCIGEKGAIMAQPASRHVRGGTGWRRTHLLAAVPDGTLYCMVYLQIRDGVGKVFFDDVVLRIVRAPRPRGPLPKIGILTDLPEDDACFQNLKLLFGDGLVRLHAESVGEQLRQCEGAAILIQSGWVAEESLEAIAAFAGEGHTIFMDIRNFAQWRGENVAAADVAPCNKASFASSMEMQMASGLRVIKASGVTAGFEPGQTIPRASAEGKLFMLLKDWSSAGVEVLAVGPGEEPGLVRARLGKGSVVAADVLSLREPYYAYVDGYYKCLFLTNALTNRVQFGEYYPRKLSYEEFVELMKETAATFPGIRFAEEGPACEGRRIYSLNLGRDGAPLYFLYAAAHGSEWEPAYGLLTFAKRVAQGCMKDVIDLGNVSIKIVPILNPCGYDMRKRQNAHGVDLNRQGDFRWEMFKGRDSTKDGKWGPWDYDWKGESPFCEPESQTYKVICGEQNLYCVLDFHGNSSGTSNKVALLPVTAREGNELRALDAQYYVNQRLRGRYVLRQSREKQFTQYLINRVRMAGDAPFLMNSSARGRYGMLVELTAGYRGSYGTVLQTDVTCEVCRALFQAYGVGDKSAR